MQWLAQNWLWLALGAGVLYFFMRRNGMRSFGMGRSHDDRRYGRDDEYAPPPAARSQPDNLVDPVSHQALSSGSATVSTVYHGRAYSFASRANRDTFEADPEKYIALSPAAGQTVEAEPYQRPRRRRGGC